MIWDIAGILIIATVLNAQITKTKFSCNGRTTGYYADISSGCQVYHMCDGLGRQFSYTCPNATLFQQRMLICDHWYMVNCSKSEDDYSANLLIGQKEKPFVEDSETHPYHRTPRPDLLLHPTASEYNIIYRTGRKQFDNNVNLVGVDNDKPESTDEPAYSLPSHWSTEYSGQSATFSSKSRNPSRNPVVNFKSNYKNTTPVYPKTVDVVTETAENFGLQPPKPYQNRNTIENFENREKVKVNFHSDFINTTPVYPKTVDVVTETAEHFGLQPPKPYQNRNTIENSENREKVKVNFHSDFINTTPVYPKTVDVVTETAESFGLQPPLPYRNKNSERNFQNQNKVNFRSDFINTTPVYPTEVELTSQEPSDLGILPPDSPQQQTSDLLAINNGDQTNIPSLSLDFAPPKFETLYERKNSTEENEVIPPSKFYQPPKFLPDFTEITSTEERGIERKREGVKSLDSDEWKNLRKKFLIPDYDFPLDSASRPSYESVFSSFQTNQDSKIKK